jgi:ATP-binding cassette, subfamily B, bacterial
MSERQEAPAWERIRKLYRVFGPYARPYRKQILLAYVALAGSVGAAAMRPWPLKFILDGVILRKRSLEETVPFFPGNLDNWDPHWLIFLFCALLVAIALIESTAGYFQKLLFARVGHSATTDVLEHTFTHLQTLPRGGRESGSGDLIVRLTSDVKTMRDLLVEHVQKLGTYGLTFATIVVIMLWLNVRLTLIGLAVVPVIWAVSWFFSRAIRKAAKRKRTREGAVASVVHENLSALAVIQAFTREEHERKRFRVQAQESLEANVESSRLGGAVNRAVQLLNVGGTALVVGFGAMRVLDGQLSPGDLVVFAAYMNDLYKPIQNLSELSVQFMDSLVSGERVLEVLETTPRIQDRPGAIPAPRFRGEIAFENVTFGYQRDCPVLRKLSFRVQPGETVALVGGSGSGKSTIMQLILRFHDPWEGRVLIDGRDVRDFQLRSLREQVSIVLQESFLFRRTVADNIAYGRPGATAAQIRAAAEAARAHEFIEQLPERYETMLDEAGSNLSGGQKQRIALARAFLRDAPILLMDEPTSGLDTVTESQLAETLDQLTRGKTTLTIAHRLSSIENAGRILVLADGCVMQEGTHAELIQQEGLYRSLHEAQERTETDHVVP